LSIDEVTSQAFFSLVQNGIISSAHGHSCKECTQKYKSIPDIILTSAPDAVLGDGTFAFEDCTDDLANAHGGAFCAFHENQYGSKCCRKTCQNQRLPETQACQQHKPQWRKYVQSHGHVNLLGVK
ncbi:hypothetical protein BDQ12DRAFT_609539, partial [Crucibulum laeve]